MNRQQSCTIYYRTHAGENSAPRPTWYSKELCLRSLLKAVESAKQHHIQITLITLHDGPISANLYWKATLKQLIDPIGEIVELPKRNNADSCLDAIQRSCGHPDDEMVIFAEDDYLWLRPAIKGICSALAALPCDYVTGYDHPVRYQPDYPLGADWPHWYTTIHVTQERHWRSQESTCMTFASRAKTLNADICYFERYHNNGKGISISPIVGQKTGLNKIVSGAVFKRGAAAPLIYLPAEARKAVKGDANCFLVRGVHRSEALRAQTLDGLRSAGYSARN